MQAAVVVIATLIALGAISFLLLARRRRKEEARQVGVHLQKLEAWRREGYAVSAFIQKWAGYLSHVAAQGTFPPLAYPVVVILIVSLATAGWTGGAGQFPPWDSDEGASTITSESTGTGSNPTSAPSGITPSATPSQTATPTPTTPTKNPAAPTPTTTTPAPEVKISLGLLTDKTGPAASSLLPVDQALKDVIRYSGEQNAIPGVTFNFVEYDTGYDPSKVKPGYEYVKEKSAKVIMGGIPMLTRLTKPWVDEDKIPYFAVNSGLTDSPDMYSPPGYTFSTDIAYKTSIYTLLNWLPESDPDFPKDRPAKIGILALEDLYAQALLDGVKQFCEAHPTQWQYVKGFIVPWTQVTFPGEVEALQGCDYVVPPSTGFFLGAFIKEMRAAGSKATFLGTDAQAAYLGMMVDMVGWEQINGMIFALPYTWWNMTDADMVKKAKYALETYHTADEQKELLWSGGSYRGGFTQWYGVMTIIKEAVERVGAQNFSSQALYDTAITFSEEFDGNVWDYSATDRQTWNSLRFYRADAQKGDLVSIGNWVPIVFSQ